MEGLPPRWWDAGRGVALVLSPTVSDMSEQMDWMSEMSKSEASLPLRLLPLLPALLPGRLEFLLDSGNTNRGKIKPLRKCTWPVTVVSGLALCSYNRD